MYFAVNLTLHKQCVALCERTSRTFGEAFRTARHRKNGATGSAFFGMWMQDKGRRSTLRTAPNSTIRVRERGARPQTLVPPPSHKASELTIEALGASHAATGFLSRIGCETKACNDPPDEYERARLIGDISRLIRESCMPETTRTAGLTLIGWLARRMPDEAPHSLGVMEARHAEQRHRATRKAR
jgi:hypothetical protein